MLTGIVVAYFALACLVVALLVFPKGRQAAYSWARRQRQRHEQLWRQRPSVRGPVVWNAGGATAAPGWALGEWAGRGRRLWRRVALVIALLLMPPAMVLWWSGGLHGGRVLDAFDDTRGPANTLVSQLLHGEQLVPPPPLPPEIFTTAEVEIVRPMLSSADRRWERLDPEFVQRLLRIFAIMKDEYGYDMALLEGYRSPERQAQLAAIGTHVTNAGAWQSYHQFGVAADCAFYRDGKLVISERDPWAARGYRLYGQVAERLGLTWGGRWRMMDLGHVEWRKPGVKLGNTP